MNFTQQIINGLSLGAIYSLIALGYTMVFGILNLINLAHGEIMMVGAYTGYILVNYFGFNLYIAMLGAIIVCCITGYLVERFCYRKILRGKKTGLVVSAIGASITIQYTIMLLFKANPRAYNIDQSQFINIYDASISKTKVFILIVSIIIMSILTYFLKYTKQGISMRAVSDKETAAMLCGINKQSAISCAFNIGCSLAAVSGVIYGSLYLINPFMGGLPGMKAFCAAILGGVGNIPGAVLGGLMLGFTETFSTVFFNSSVKDILTFVILLTVLLFLPGGLTGSNKGDNRV
ncbi:MAG: branched-chain amino acid ABC transporter permease [Oscillospiraceae bacterium]